jgi:hypothetical protein
MTNHLLIGTADKTERLLQITKPHFLLIDDGPIDEAFLARFPHAKLFDPQEHSFNPLRNMDYKRARDFAQALYTASPEGKETLTVRNGKRALLTLLLSKPTRLDRLPRSTDPGSIEALETVNDMLLSPVLKNVLCHPTNFSFKGTVVAKIDRAELGDFDAFLLGTLLIGQYQRHVILPDFGFYGRPFHTSLIRQNRLTAGVQFLSELEPKLQQAALTMREKTAYRVTTEDAEKLLPYFQTAYFDSEQRTVTKPSHFTELDDGDYFTTCPFLGS